MDIVRLAFRGLHLRLLGAIPGSLVLAGLGWFLGYVVLRFPIPSFVDLWRWAFIGWAGCVLVRQCAGGVIGHFLIVGRARVWQVSYDEAKEALLVYGLARDRTWARWDKETFHQKLALRQIRGQLSHVITRNLLGNRRQ